jgi:glycosyltransferase involved in cell wall biosynthesis
VIASDSGEIPHVVGDAGVVVPERDQAAWNCAIESPLMDPARRRLLSQRGRLRAESEYAWPLIAKRHADFFIELIERQR